MLDLEKYPNKKQYYSKNRKINTPKDKKHPTQKPIEYLKGIIELTTNEEDVVLDSFFGSGETGIACLELNRNCIGIELTEKYFNISKKRNEDYKQQTKLF